MFHQTLQRATRKHSGRDLRSCCVSQEPLRAQEPNQTLLIFCYVSLIVCSTHSGHQVLIDIFRKIQVHYRKSGFWNVRNSSWIRNPRANVTFFFFSDDSKPCVMIICKPFFFFNFLQNFTFVQNLSKFVFKILELLTI